VAGRARQHRSGGGAGTGVRPATLRLRADYLAIVTITAGETLRLLVNAGGEGSLTRGPFGIQHFAGGFFAINPIPAGNYGFGRVTFSDADLWVMVVA